MQYLAKVRADVNALNTARIQIYDKILNIC